MKKISILIALFLIISKINAQSTVTFPSPGAQIICSTTSPYLDTVTATDGVKINAHLRLEASCLDTNLATFSLNSPATYRKPTFCYNNGYFPSSYGYPLAISRNSTANSGNCATGRSVIISDFTQGTIKPKGLSFIVCDIDNPYDSCYVKVYSGGSLTTYTYAFLEPNTDSSYAWTGATGNTGTEIHFNGGARNGWYDASATSNWAKGAIQFTTQADIEIDSVILVHVMKNNRPDINAGISIGNFVWTAPVVTPVTFGKFEVTLEANNLPNLHWSTLTEINNKYFELEKSNNGTDWIVFGKVNSKSQTGNSASELKYNYTDPTPYNGLNYYRIKQIDLDGNFEYSKVNFLKISTLNTIKIWPTIIKNGAVSIDNLKPNSNISIVNSLGQIVYKQTTQQPFTEIQTGNLSKGIYFLNIQMENNNKIIHSKIIIE